MGAVAVGLEGAEAGRLLTVTGSKTERQLNRRRLAICVAFGRDFTRGRSAVRVSRRFKRRGQRWPRGEGFGAVGGLSL